MKKVLVALLVIRFYPFLIGKTVFFGDNYSLLVPGKIFTALWLRQGILTLWNPYVFGGIPWIGDINQSLFSISTLLFSLLPISFALNATVLVYSVITYSGMFLFALTYLRSERAGIVAATIWLFSAFFTGSINNISVLQSLSLIPWVLYFGAGYWRTPIGMILTSLSIVGMLLGGYPQFIPYAVFVALFLSFQKSEWKPWLLSWVSIICIAVGSSAFAWMPFIETVQDSTRSLQTAIQSQVGSLRIPDLLSFVLPNVFFDARMGLKWGPVWNASSTTVPYISWVGLLALPYLFLTKKYTKRDVVWGALCCVSLLFAFSSVLPLFPLLQSIVPFFKASRGPQLALIIVELFSALWIADLYVRFEKLKIARKWIRIFAIILFLLILVWVSVQIFFPLIWNSADTLLSQRLSLSSFHTLAKDELIAKHVLTLLMVHVALLTAILFAHNRKHFMLLVLLIALEMHISTSSTLFFAPSDVYPNWKDITISSSPKDRVLFNNGNQPYTDFATYWESMSVRAPFSDSYVDTKELQDFIHIKRMRQTMTPNWNMVYGVPSMNGYVAFVPKDVHEKWNGGNDPAINFLPEISTTNPQLIDLGVNTYVVDTWFPHQTPTLQEIGRQDTRVTYELPKTSRFRLSDGAGIEKENIIESPNEQKIRIDDAKEEESLYIGDRYDPNWSVTINEQSVPLINKNGTREIKLKSGDNDVHLQYKPQSFTKGIVISLITLSVVAATLFVYKKTKLLSK